MSGNGVRIAAMVRQVVHLMVVAAAIAGCASERAAPIPDQETIAIIDEPLSVAIVDPMVNRDSIEVVGSAGAQGGLLAGAAASASLCGPGFLICLPFFGTTGAIIGTATGQVVGAADEALGVLPSGTTNRVQIVLSEIGQRRDFREELRRALADSIESDRLRDPTTADVHAHATPMSIELLQGKGPLVALRVTALVLVRRSGDENWPEDSGHKYSYKTSEMPMEFWLSDGARPLNDGFSECIRKIALMMAWDLAPPTG